MNASELKPGERFYFPDGPVARRVFTARNVTTTNGERCNTFGGKDAVATVTIVTGGCVFNCDARQRVERAA